MKQENKSSVKTILTDYRIYIGIIVILLIIIAVLLKGGDKKDEAGEANQPPASDVTAEDQNPAPEQTEGNPEGEGEQPEAVPDNKLEENTHASIDRLIEKYCASIVSGDVDTLESIVDVLSEEDKEKVRSRAEMIESSDNITCYTKDGPEEDSYIVFVCYDMKLKDIKTTAPDILCLYVGPRGEDGRKIHYGTIDESTQAYVDELAKDPEVQALYDDVSARYQAALDSDESLANFIQRINGQVAEEEEPEETPEEEPGAPEETPEEEPEAPEEEPSAGEASVQNRQTRVSSTVNVRSEMSTESSRLAVAYQGDSITQIESYDNGWSKVEYKGQTGYVMTEYLE